MKEESNLEDLLQQQRKDIFFEESGMEDFLRLKKSTRCANVRDEGMDDRKTPPFKHYCSENKCVTVSIFLEVNKVR